MTSVVRVVLLLMVRNESRIIQRCLEAAASDVDAVLLADTGSEDDTIALAEACCERLEKPLHVVHHEWRDFGHNRTLSLEAAVEYARSLGWDLDASWAFAQDPDMVWRPKKPVRTWLDETRLDSYLLRQTNVGMEYENLRLLRLSRPWRSLGVTHEHWDCDGASLARCSPDLGSFDDLGDGGCKADKFERDERLLLDGLTSDPTNTRYFFYLAQTYWYMKRYAEAAEWYVRRIAKPLGLDDEEVWYSTYRVAHCHVLLEDLVEGEHWAQKAARSNPGRAEALMLLVEAFRVKEHWFKAWHYLLLAEAVPPATKPYLFYELEAHGHRRAFEKSVLSFYVRPDRRAEGLDLCMAYEGPAPFEARVLVNACIYAEPARALLWGQLHFPAPEAFVASSVAVSRGVLNVRTVDYRIRADGSYELRDGLVRTRNFKSSWDDEALRWTGFEEVVGVPGRAEAVIKGLEDVRLCGSNWTATTVEHSYCSVNRMCWGDAYPHMSFTVLKPPAGETACEKNWLPLENRRVIYGWHPLIVGQVPLEGDKLVVVAEHATPAWFRHLRGSAPPVELDDGLWVLTHFVAPTAPRVYLHVWVVLEKGTLKPLKASRPFWFRHRGIEYCLGVCSSREGKELQCFVSIWDREAWVCKLDVEALRTGIRSFT